MAMVALLAAATNLRPVVEVYRPSTMRDLLARSNGSTCTDCGCKMRAGAS
jgi:hypothetical protein